MEQDAEVHEFCRAVWPRLAASMGLVCRDAAMGEEIAQEALIRVWTRWDRVSKLDFPEGWAYRVAVNLSRSRHRRSQAERRALARLNALEPRPAPDGSEAIAIHDALAMLPERQRAALVLRYFADLSIATTADVLGCAQGTVKSLTSQAIDRLRQEFTVDHVEEAAVE